MKLRVILTGRSASVARPPTRNKVEPLTASHYTRPQTRAQFTRRHSSQRQEDSNHRRHWRGFQSSPLVDSPEKPVLEWPTLMLDWRLIREHREEVRARLGARAQDIDWDGLHTLDQDRRELLSKVEDIRHKRKSVADHIAKLKGDNRSVEALMEELRGGGDRRKSLEDPLRD